MTDYERVKEASRDALADLTLLIEYIEWRRQEGLTPSPLQLRRLDRWTRLAAEQAGVLFADWAQVGERR